MSCCLATVNIVPGALPAEELGNGAKAMLQDGLFTRFPKPDYGFAAHVGPMPIHYVTVKQGIVSSASDSIYITFHGVGAHGSMPDKSIDPIVEGVHFVDDVQTVISRQKDPQKFGVITVGSFNAGTVANIIPDHADLQLTVRSFDPEVRKLLNEGITATAQAVANMAHAPAPDVRHVAAVSAVINDSALGSAAATVLERALGGENVTLAPEYLGGATASEDYSEYVAAGITRSVFFAIGGYDPATIERYKAEGKLLPVNHSPQFAPVPEPTVRTGVRTLTLAVLMVTSR